MVNARLAFRISAILGFLGVALGAMGAHALEDTLTAHERLDTWETAALYHLIHALILAFIAGRAPFLKGAWWAFFIGILLFSGSLYILSLTNVTMLGAVTPFGGVAFLTGWAWLAIKGL